MNNLTDFSTHIKRAQQEMEIVFISLKSKGFFNNLKEAFNNLIDFRFKTIDRADVTVKKLNEIEDKIQKINSTVLEANKDKPEYRHLKAEFDKTQQNLTNFIEDIAGIKQEIISKKDLLTDIRISQVQKNQEKQNLREMVKNANDFIKNYKNRRVDEDDVVHEVEKLFIQHVRSEMEILGENAKAEKLMREYHADEKSHIFTKMEVLEKGIEEEFNVQKNILIRQALNNFLKNKIPVDNMIDKIHLSDEDVNDALRSITFNNKDYIKFVIKQILEDENNVNVITDELRAACLKKYESEDENRELRRFLDEQINDENTPELNEYIKKFILSNYIEKRSKVESLKMHELINELEKSSEEFINEIIKNRKEYLTTSVDSLKNKIDGILRKKEIGIANREKVLNKIIYNAEDSKNDIVLNRYLAKLADLTDEEIERRIHKELNLLLIKSINELENNVIAQFANESAEFKDKFYFNLEKKLGFSLRKPLNEETFQSIDNKINKVNELTREYFSDLKQLVLKEIGREDENKKIFDAFKSSYSRRETALENSLIDYPKELVDVIKIKFKKSFDSISEANEDIEEKISQFEKLWSVDLNTTITPEVKAYIQELLSSIRNEIVEKISFQEKMRTRNGKSHRVVILQSKEFEELDNYLEKETKKLESLDQKNDKLELINELQAFNADEWVEETVKQFFYDKISQLENVAAGLEEERKKEAFDRIKELKDSLNQLKFGRSAIQEKLDQIDGLSSFMKYKAFVAVYKSKKYEEVELEKSYDRKQFFEDAESDIKEYGLMDTSFAQEIKEQEEILPKLSLEAFDKYKRSYFDKLKEAVSENLERKWVERQVEEEKKIKAPLLDMVNGTWLIQDMETKNNINKVELHRLPFPRDIKKSLKECEKFEDLKRINEDFNAEVNGFVYHNEAGIKEEDTSKFEKFLSSRVVASWVGVVRGLPEASIKNCQVKYDNLEGQKPNLANFDKFKSTELRRVHINTVKFMNDTNKAAEKKSLKDKINFYNEKLNDYENKLMFETSKRYEDWLKTQR